MKKFSFAVDMISDNLDIEITRAEIQQFLTEKHDGVVSKVKSAGVKSFSEQGFKVWRARVTGVTAKQAGDSHNPKVATNDTAS
jgi:hypothetical protein